MIASLSSQDIDCLHLPIHEPSYGNCLVLFFGKSIHAPKIDQIRRRRLLLLKIIKASRAFDFSIPIPAISEISRQVGNESALAQLVTKIAHVRATAFVIATNIAFAGNKNRPCALGFNFVVALLDFKLPK